MANFRVFKAPGLIAYVSVGIGPEDDRQWHNNYDVDAQTGVIAIPAQYSPSKVQSRKQMSRANVVQAFQLQVAHHADTEDLYVVTQRSADNAYKRQLPGMGMRELATYNFAPVPVEYRNRDDNHQDAERRTGPAIFTAMKSRDNDSGTNRVDTWVFKKDGSIWLYQILVTSFDDGKTWRAIGKLDGPTPGNSKYFVFTDVPKGARAALVRLAGSQNNTLGFFDLRVDADYAQPNGGFDPVKVTYVWEENGAEKRDVHIAKQANETYTITCATKPLLKSLIVERAE